MLLAPLMHLPVQVKDPLVVDKTHRRPGRHLKVNRLLPARNNRLKDIFLIHQYLLFSARKPFFFFFRLRVLLSI